MRALLALLLLARIPNGDWGGDHVRLTVTDQGASLEFDCGHGAIAEPLALKDGALDVHGTYVFEHGGPVRKDESREGKPARYRGTFDGKTLTIRVVVGEGDAVGPFTLEPGKRGRVVKCR